MKTVAQMLFVLCSVFIITEVVCSDPSITDCSDGFKYVTEDTAATFTCINYGKKVFWYFYDGMYETAVGNCKNEQCNSSDSSRFKVQAKDTGGMKYKSQLKILKVAREQDHFLRCYDNENNRVSCEVEVIARALIHFETCSVKLSNWQVHGTCSIFRMYATDGNYKCAWYKDNVEKYLYEEFKDTLQTYPGNNSRFYRSGICRFDQQIPILEGNYTYSLKIFPGFGVYYNDTIRISYPQGLTHNCPQHVFEGSDLNCTCKLTTIGSPPAQLKWDGQPNELLQVTNASRQLNGELHICRLLWGPNGYMERNTSYIINIAYGPSAVFLTSNRGATEKGSESFTCTASDVYPSAVFTWSIKCHTQTNSTNISTCVINITEQHEQLSVNCTARNLYFQTLFHSRTLELPIITNKAADTTASTKSVSGGLIGGVTAAAVILLVIIAVFVVYIIKCRKVAPTGEFKGMPGQEREGTKFLSLCKNLFHENISLSNLYAVVKKPKTQTSIERHSAPSCDLYTIPSSVTTQQGEDEYVSVYEAAENTIFYEESVCGPEQVSDETNEWTAPAQSTVKPIEDVEKIQNISGNYVNVTTVPTDSGLAVYHLVSLDLVSGTVNPDSSTQATSEEEYNALHFGKDRPGQDAAAADYNHLQITENNYFILERE